MINIDLKLRYYILFSFIVLIFVGCDNFLTPEPETFGATQNFFESNKQFKQAVGGAYNSLQAWALKAYNLEEMRSDNTTFDNLLNRGVKRSLYRIDWFLMTPQSVPQNNGAWNTIYTGIKNCNVTLSHINNGIKNGNLSQDLGRRLGGELKFIRAYFYFTAVRLWGHIPLILKPVKSASSAFEIKQTSKDEVFKAITNDLTNAINNLPTSYNSSNTGRVTKGAAKSLLAKVYLWRKKYSKAENLLKEVVNSGQYSLLQNYAEIFDPNNKNNSEIIFSIQFKKGSKGQSSNFIYQFTPVGSYPDVIPKLVGDGTWGRNIPIRGFVNSYEKGDLRKKVSIGFFSRVNAANIPYVKKWAHATDPNFARTNDNWPVIRYGGVLLLLAEAVNAQGYNTGLPFNVLNKVRHRADLSSLTPVDLPNQEAFSEALLRERRHELAFENKRWFDLIRFGVAVDTMKVHGQKAVKNPVTPYTSNFPLDPRAFHQIKKSSLVYPIPFDVMNANPNLKQNPGYE